MSDVIDSKELQSNGAKMEIDWVRCIPFYLLHLSVVSVFYVDFSWMAVVMLLLMYFPRMFGLTGFYHRYYAHRAFKTSRWFQFVGAVLGGAAIQRGALWWASHHRDHHRHSDTEKDIHSPKQTGFFYSHMGWFMTKENFKFKANRIKDFTKYPELVFINKHDVLIPVLFFIFCFCVGEFWNGVWGITAEEAKTSPWALSGGWQVVAYSFCLGTVLLYHSTFFVNSLAHVWGTRPYKTTDTSRNNLFIAILTMGEGWHNNHHHFQSAARNGFRWYQIDLTYMILKMLSFVGIVWDLKPVPKHVVHRTAKAEEDQAQKDAENPTVV